MWFIGRLPLLGDEIEVYVPIIPNLILWLMWILPSEYLWKALALWRFLVWALLGGDPYCD